jgi:hypothetical protein
VIAATGGAAAWVGTGVGGGVLTEGRCRGGSDRRGDGRGGTRRRRPRRRGFPSPRVHRDHPEARPRRLRERAPAQRPAQAHGRPVGRPEEDLLRVSVRPELEQDG